MPATKRKIKGKTKADKAKQVEVKNNDRFVWSELTSSRMPNPRSRTYVRDCRQLYDKHDKRYPDPDNWYIKGRNYSRSWRSAFINAPPESSREHLDHLVRIPTITPDLGESAVDRQPKFVLAREASERRATIATEQDAMRAGASGTPAEAVTAMGSIVDQSAGIEEETSLEVEINEAAAKRAEIRDISDHEMQTMPDLSTSTKTIAKAENPQAKPIMTISTVENQDFATTAPSTLHRASLSSIQEEAEDITGKATSNNMMDGTFNLGPDAVVRKPLSAIERKRKHRAASRRLAAEKFRTARACEEAKAVREKEPI